MTENCWTLVDAKGNELDLLDGSPCYRSSDEAAKDREDFPAKVWGQLTPHKRAEPCVMFWCRCCRLPLDDSYHYPEEVTRHLAKESDWVEDDDGKWRCDQCPGHDTGGLR